VSRCSPEQTAFFTERLKSYTAANGVRRKARTGSRHSIAVLHDPKEAMPPSSRETLMHWAKLAAPLGVEVEPITRRDFGKLAEYDALVHSRDHVDPQPHLPVRPARGDGAHAGHRRSDLDDPLHQQGLSLGTADPCRPSRSGHGGHPGAGGHPARRRHPGLSRSW
jgi:hypothetical protein